MLPVTAIARIVLTNATSAPARVGAVTTAWVLFVTAGCALVLPGL
jgi:hypothetical protein